MQECIRIARTVRRSPTTWESKAEMRPAIAPPSKGTVLMGAYLIIRNF